MSRDELTYIVHSDLPSAVEGISAAADSFPLGASPTTESEASITGASSLTVEGSMVTLFRRLSTSVVLALVRRPSTIPVDFLVKLTEFSAVASEDPCGFSAGTSVSAST